MPGFRSQRRMRQESEWAESIVGADYNDAITGERRSERSHLAITLGITSTMEIKHDRTPGPGFKGGGPNIHIQTVFAPADIGKPSRRHLGTSGPEVCRFTCTGPLLRRLRRSPSRSNPVHTGGVAQPRPPERSYRCDRPIMVPGQALTPVLFQKSCLVRHPRR